MPFSLTAFFCLLATTAIALPTVKRDGISITPHDVYSSSIGVLGCKIDTNRVAYFPGSADCNNMCIKVSHGGRSVNLLRIDSSGGAYDISYDAWNYLYTGKSATEDPQSGGGIDATMETVDMSECSDLIKDPTGKLALSAANAVNTYVACPNNFVLYNIADPACTLGVDEVCHMPPANEGNQPVCPTSQLGVQTPLKGDTVYNIMYPSGKKEPAA